MQDRHSITIGEAFSHTETLCSKLPIRSGSMSQNPPIRRRHAHLCSFIFLSWLLSRSLPLCLSLTHPHSHMCLHNHIVSHKQSRGEQRGTVMPSDGNVFQLKSDPKVTPAAPNRADGPSCHHGRRVHGTVGRSGCFTGCALLVLNNCTRFLCFKTEPNLISVQSEK